MKNNNTELTETQRDELRNVLAILIFQMTEYYHDFHTKETVNIVYFVNKRNSLFDEVIDKIRSTL